jgi:hypothetical protein
MHDRGKVLLPRTYEERMIPDRAEPSADAALAPLLHEGAALFTTNPFEERWLDLQKRLLGHAYQDRGRVLALVDDPELPDLARVMELLHPVHAASRQRLKAGARVTPGDLSAYVAVGWRASKRPGRVMPPPCGWRGTSGSPSPRR